MGWQDLLGEYGRELIAWAHEYGEEQKMQAHQRKVKRYCVPCLKEDRRTPAVTVVNSAGYCANHRPEGAPDGATAAKVLRAYRRLNDVEKAEILGRPAVSAEALGRIYGVSGQTIRNLRMEAELSKPPAPVANPVAEMIEHVAALPPLDEPELEAEPMVFPCVVCGAPSKDGYRWCDECRADKEKGESLPQSPAVEPVKLTLELAVDHERADRVWNSLELDIKARIIASVVAERWAGLL
jgi:hypothetical protein